MTPRTRYRFAAVLTATVMAWAAGAMAQAQAPAVLVTPASMIAVTDQADFLGRVQATDKVQLRARVDGFLTERRFKEGQFVKEGDILFVIDKAPFEAAVDQRKAELASAEALAKNAELQLVRTKELAEKGNAPTATLDQRVAEDAKAKADIMRAQAALRTAEINLSWTDVKAPISGRIGQAQVTPGNLVGPSSPPLAALVNIDPINVTFPVTQRELLTARSRAGGEPEKIAIRLRLADGSIYEEVGKVQLLDVEFEPRHRQRDRPRLDPQSQGHPDRRNGRPRHRRPRRGGKEARDPRHDHRHRPAGPVRARRRPGRQG